MKALTFEFAMSRLATARVLGAIATSGFLTELGPLRLADVPDAKILGDRWVVIETAMCGVCGSDVKQVFMNAAMDNPLTSVISFPHVLGHEHVGTVVETGKHVSRVKKGDRVACSPWLSCVPRGLPECDACKAGHVSLCESFTKGAFSPGMHAGTCRDVSGGFATHVPVHETSCHVIPDNVEWDDAVLADPFAVALHAILKAPPEEGETALVIGCGGLGSLVVHVLANLFPKTRIFAVDPRENARELAQSLGAHTTFAERGKELIEKIADTLGEKIMRPQFALPWIHHGVDRVYDTVGAPGTLEAALRVIRPRASIVMVGVATPGRFEWTPLYFKEATLTGSAGYGDEVLLGHRAHAIAHAMNLLGENRVAPKGVLTHRFALADYKNAFFAARSDGARNSPPAIKVAFDFRNGSTFQTGATS